MGSAKAALESFVQSKTLSQLLLSWPITDTDLLAQTGSPEAAGYQFDKSVCSQWGGQWTKAYNPLWNIQSSAASRIVRKKKIWYKKPKCHVLKVCRCSLLTEVVDRAYGGNRHEYFPGQGNTCKHMVAYKYVQREPFPHFKQYPNHIWKIPDQILQT